VVAALVAAGVPVERVGPSRRLEDAFLALIAEPALAGAEPPGLAEAAGDGLASKQGAV
jgi:hypothetical protein